MARGRFISNDVINDKEMNDLSSDTCRLAYVFLITLADREGRVAGDPVYLKSLLFPRRYDINPDTIQDFIQEWVNAGFVIWYECSNGEKALRLVNFEKHQRGLRKDREQASEYDDPADCKILAGDVSENGKDLKEKDNKESLIKNININGNDAKNDGINPDLIPQNDGLIDEKEIQLVNTFCEITKIGLPENPSIYAKWLTEAGEWQKLKVTRDVIERAYQTAIEKEYTIVRPQGLTNFIKGVIKNGNQQQDITKLLEEVWND